MTGQNRKTIQQRYQDLSPQRLREQPRDQDEELFAQSEAEETSKAIWDHYFRDKPNHTRRVLEILAKEALGSKQQTMTEDLYD